MQEAVALIASYRQRHTAAMIESACSTGWAGVEGCAQARNCLRRRRPPGDPRAHKPRGFVGRRQRAERSRIAHQSGRGGSAEAQYQLGVMYANASRPADDFAARALFEKRLRKSFPALCWRWAYLPRTDGRGRGCPRRQSYYERAIALGNEDAKARSALECPACSGQRATSYASRF